MPVCWGYSFDFPPDIRLSAMSMGGQSCGLLVDGSPICWGYGFDPDSIDRRRRPPLEAMVDERFTAISSGYEHACALRESGEPICWTWDAYGYLDEVELVPYGERLVSITSGGQHACGLREDGTAVCWGSNWSGQSELSRGVRFAVLEGGNDYTCGLQEAGTAVCWGEDEFGESSPPEIEQFTTISASLGLWHKHTCGLRPDGNSRLLGHE